MSPWYFENVKLIYMAWSCWMQ